MRTCVVLKFSGKFYTYEMFPMVLALITLRFSTLLQLSSGEYMSMQQKKKKPHFNGFPPDCCDPNIMFVVVITSA